MSKKFLFITHLTPVNLRSKLRQGLIENMTRSLLNQRYSNWEALWIGENEFINDKITEVKITNRGDLKSIYEREEIKQKIENADFIVKLDDDDFISPNALMNSLKHEFDCYCDEYHTFYDITSGSLTQQKRNWIASTCIHKKDHAIINPSTNKIADNFINSLFYGEHGKDWISYYKTKKIVYANRRNPIYIRILSPTSISSGAKIFPIQGLKDVDMNAYYKYLKTFGTWNSAILEDTNLDVDFLKSIWSSFSGNEQSRISGISIFAKLKDKIKYLIHA
jgi:hypothetical protein